ncbi:hypothetical protein K505DRAFT_343214 [Melanomma pulvis-pyrius CBS 109.77]|uniref:Uncharacterized protein n=1 Tax=Melanomma pulvis-pyrius CBS 109.77 TaxID=1314802 RepID=A0A6A6WSR9_9PLEO|nr:hypothetical protein K505DRAFT_343214 [Melanomma pulvis-pyrius CBS 109.77]
MGSLPEGAWKDTQSSLARLDIGYIALSRVCRRSFQQMEKSIGSPGDNEIVSEERGLGIAMSVLDEIDNAEGLKNAGRKIVETPLSRIAHNSLGGLLKSREKGNPAYGSLAVNDYPLHNRGTVTRNDSDNDTTEENGDEDEIEEDDEFLDPQATWIGSTTTPDSSRYYMPPLNTLVELILQSGATVYNYGFVKDYLRAYNSSCCALNSNQMRRTTKSVLKYSTSSMTIARPLPAATPTARDLIGNKPGEVPYDITRFLILEEFLKLNEGGNLNLDPLVAPS